MPGKTNNVWVSGGVLRSLSHAQALVVSQELATINVNSPVLCNEAESHETLEESMWPK